MASRIVTGFRAGVGVLGTGRDFDGGCGGGRKRRLWDAYAFPGFGPETTVRGIFGDPKARIVRLKRRSKKRAAP